MSTRLALALGGTVLSILMAILIGSVSKLNMILDAVQKPALQTVFCEGNSACLKFRHESELIIPPMKMVDGCPPYVLPTMPAMPTPAVIEIPAGADDQLVVKLLLEYIDRVLENDQNSKNALLKHYQDYIAACAPDLPEPANLVKTE